MTDCIKAISNSLGSELDVRYIDALKPDEEVTETADQVVGRLSEGLRRLGEE